MGVTVREAECFERRTATILVDSSEELPVPYAARRFRVARLTAQWARRDDGPWELESVVAFGQVVKKDGSLSSLTGKRDLTSLGWVDHPGTWKDDAPEWARALADRYAPAEAGA